MEDYAQAIDTSVDAFTDKQADLIPTVDYLLWALRGGLYDQGGPALSEITNSMRNRARSEMDMRHNMIMTR
ncbi:MAG: hypothetical protein COC19_04135 [SAR86 cluster bacterium]|uniref:Uncharacterized protein n=1 Tax=SAR86 cluster bacterium TaxID=2030880 RepID=A0A2A4MP05_9GAMM|nr:MAG: hypothetical protein COC19_04135 [SAR86 cluster bacterium]